MICEAFSCTPAEALQQDWPLVEAVLDYRTALAAKDAMNEPDKAQGFERLRRNPSMLRSLQLMHRAQTQATLEGGDVEGEGIAVANAYREGDEE